MENPTNFLDLLKEIFQKPRYDYSIIFLSFSLKLKGFFKSIRQTLKELNIKVSHVAIYKWIRRISKHLKLANEKKKRKILLIDETVIKYQRKRFYFW